MPQGGRPDGALADLAGRRDALRQAVGLPGADAGSLIDAALTELDGAIDALAVALTAAPVGRGDAPPDGLPGTAERRLLHAAFQRTPAALFLLEQDSTIRRANDQAAALLGFPAGYATGKPLTSFVDLPFRAARADAAGGGRADRRGPEGQLPGADLDRAARRHPDGGRGRTARRPAAVHGHRRPGRGRFRRHRRRRRDGRRRRPRPPPAVIEDTTDPAITAMTKRLDMVTAVTRLLLDNSTFSEAVTLQRCARLLAGELADWVIIDIDRGGQLRRQFAAGSRDGQADRRGPVGAERAARAVDPDPESAPWQVHSTGKSVLLAHPDDPSVLGTGPDGTPLLMTLGATSLICVPISDGTHRLRRADAGAAGRPAAASASPTSAWPRSSASTWRTRSGSTGCSAAGPRSAEALQASLMPASLPTVPWLEFAAAYIGATQWQEISGDFYDVFPASDGWAIAIGDVCGKGQDAAAMTAAARHSIRALAHVHDAPADVLTAANQVLLAGDYGERFVTASLAFLRQHGRRVQVRLGGCGHPGPAVVRADGRVEILEADGMPLGLFGDSEASKVELELREGDLLFFYTDGVTEARSADLAFFEDRLADELASVAGRSAAETVRAVQELVTSFSDGELRDDVTMLAVRVGP